MLLKLCRHILPPSAVRVIPLCGNVRIGDEVVWVGYLTLVDAKCREELTSSQLFPPFYADLKSALTKVRLCSANPFAILNATGLGRNYAWPKMHMYLWMHLCGNVSKLSCVNFFLSLLKRKKFWRRIERFKG